MEFYDADCSNDQRELQYKILNTKLYHLQTKNQRKLKNVKFYIEKYNDTMDSCNQLIA